jgi:ceramide glucosyltransferase
MEIFIIFAAATILGLIGYVLQIWSIRSALKNKIHDVRRMVHNKGNHVPRIMDHESRSYPPISVLKPLKGLDDNLFDNLASICVQDYPEYEIIFSLQDHNDPAYKVTRKIRGKYPDKDITIMVERCNAGLNPKMNNLIPAYRIAKFGYILISDSNVMVSRNYLQDIVQHMEDPEVGLVSNMIKGTGGRTLGSIFENLHMNSFVMGSVCFLDKFLKMPCVVGKSMLMKKQDLDAIGGFKALKDVLAEDYLIGKKMHEKGKKVILSSHVIKNVNEYWGIRKFINRHTRWGKLRWKIGGIRYFSELFSNAVFMSFLPILLWEPSRITVTFAACVSSIKILGDLYIGRKIKPKMNCLLYFLSPVKDLVIGLIWFAPVVSTTVVWRGNRYIIGKDSVLSPCPETGIWSWRYRFADSIKARLA